MRPLPTARPLTPLARLARALLTLSLAACASTPRGPASTTPHKSGSNWHTDALAVSAGTDFEARGRAIVARLEALGIPVERQPFATGPRAGVNIIAALPDTRDLPVLMIGAHYDRVDVGQGAVDNASSCATLLDLGASFMNAPLAHHRVVLAFWDLEELGLLGSKAWIASGARPPALYLNFDVFGYGDTIWGMIPDAPGSAPAAFGLAVGEAGAAAGMKTSLGEAYPPTDHLAFLEAGLPAVSLSLVGGDEIPHILDVFAGRQPTVMPRVIATIHTPNDVPEALDPPAVRRALPVVLDTIRRWDAGAPRG